MMIIYIDGSTNTFLLSFKNTIMLVYTRYNTFT